LASRIRDPLQRRHIDPAAIGRPSFATGIVIEADEDIGCAFRGFVGKKGLPVRSGITDVEIDGSFEGLHFVFS